MPHPEQGPTGLSRGSRPLRRDRKVLAAVVSAAVLGGAALLRDGGSGATKVDTAGVVAGAHEEAVGDGEDGLPVDDLAAGEQAVEDEALADGTTTTRPRAPTSTVRPAARASRPAVTAPRPGRAVAAEHAATTSTTAPPRRTTTTTRRRQAPTTTTTKPRPRYSESGEATFYDYKEGTCAHKTIPFGTVVTVTNLANGATTTCTVADRGPFVEGRIIDLERRVFARIAPLGEGVIDVRITWS